MSEKKPVLDLNAAIAELEQIEKYFQSPEINLEEAIEKHKAALELGKKILTHLQSVESTLKQIDIAGLKKEE